MTLDLNTLFADWPDTGEGVSARVIDAEDGQPYLQLRIELGVLQMFPDGRPDGERYRTSPNVLHFVQKGMSRGRTLTEADWSELKRELQQFNYRRVAFTSLAERALEANRPEDARAHLLRCVRDIDHCIQIVKAMEEGRAEGAGSQALMIPTLIFNRARQLAHLRITEQRQAEAIEEAEAGAAALERFFSENGAEPAGDEGSPGVRELRALANSLRGGEAGVEPLERQLAEAIEREDFEAAARIRDQIGALQRRPRG